MQHSFPPAPLKLLQLSTLWMLFAFRASATCYYPNGTADNTNTYAPCNPNGPSMCCQTGSAVDSAQADTCRNDGFCIPNDNNGIWRRLCTDQTWKDPACINLCAHGPAVDPENYIYDNATAAVTTCGDRSLCCGSIDQEAGQTCCSHRKGVYLENGKLVSTPPASAAASTAATASPTSSSSPSSSSSSASPSPNPSSNNTGAIVGGVVGGIAGIVAAALAFWYFMIRKSLRQRSQAPNGFEPYNTGTGKIWQDPSEAPTYERRGELDSTPAQAGTLELDGSGRGTS